jgi:hypothetical protein
MKFKDIRIKEETIDDRLEYHIFNDKHDDLLGKIKYFDYWGKLGFFPEVDSVFDSNCLDELGWFIRTKNKLNARKPKNNRTL